MTSTSTEETALGHRISRPTVLRRVRAEGIREYCPFRRMALTSQHRRDILRLARQVRRWKVRNWQRVILPDMNTLEHLWDHLDIHITCHQHINSISPLNYHGNMLVYTSEVCCAFYNMVLLRIGVELTH